MILDKAIELVQTTGDSVLMRRGRSSMMVILDNGKLLVHDIHSPFPHSPRSLTADELEKEDWIVVPFKQATEKYMAYAREWAELSQKYIMMPMHLKTVSV